MSLKHGREERAKRKDKNPDPRLRPVNKFTSFDVANRLNGMVNDMLGGMLSTRLTEADSACHKPQKNS